MRVACILGSPRGSGSSAALAASFLEEAASLAPVETRTFFLAGLDYRGCAGCYACKTGAEGCVIDDDLSEALEAVRNCDLLLLASPVYFGDITGQAKCFFDRTFGFYKPEYIGVKEPSRLAPGKKAVLILTQGSPDEGSFADVGRRYAFWLESQGFSPVEVVRAVGMPGRKPAPPDQTSLQAARSAARRLLAAGQGA